MTNGIQAAPDAAVHFAPMAIARPDFVLIENAVDATELEKIETLCADLLTTHRLIGPAGEIKHDQLDVHVAPIGVDQAGWLYMAMEKRIHAANASLRIEIWGFAEDLQFTSYRDGRYCWHMDSAIADDGFPHPPRKLSFELMLSDPVDYEGGARELMGGAKHSFKPSRGSLLVWPSHVISRVYHVKGTRRSIEGWVCGEEFR